MKKIIIGSGKKIKKVTIKKSKKEDVINESGSNPENRGRS
jgi:hypothetical protein